VITRGITLGISEHNRILNDLNRYSIHRAMSKNAQSTLSLSPLIIKEEPSRKVTLEPVSSIW